MNKRSFDSLDVYLCSDRNEMGAAAARRGKEAIKKALEEKAVIRVMFAAAPSQNEVLKELVAAEDVDWSRVQACNMDEYIGLGPDAVQGFAYFLREHIFGLLPFHSVRCFKPVMNEAEAAAELAEYEDFLKEASIDVCFMGIGENGHLAFNDPPVADFNDAHLSKMVRLDELCRHQQVHDGCFGSIDLVPETAMTATVPALFSASAVICTVPSAAKASAVKAALTGPVSEACPASILRRHRNASLFLDREAASLLPDL